MSAKTELSFLSPKPVVEAAQRFLAAAKGKYSDSSTTPRQSGLDVYTPYTQRQAILLHRALEFLEVGLTSISSLSIFAKTMSNEPARISIQTLKPVTQNQRGWWAIGLLEYESPEYAQAAMKAAADYTEFNVPVALLSEVFKPGEDEDLCNATINALANATKGNEGLGGFGIKQKAIKDINACVLLFSPSGPVDDETALWKNPASSRASRPRPQGNAPASFSGGELDMPY